MKRFDVYLINLDPTQGSEINKTRPGVIISPDELISLKTVIIAPMTTKGFHFPSRVSCQFKDKKALIVLDQMRSVDKSRLLKKVGSLSQVSQRKIVDILQEMFAF